MSSYQQRSSYGPAETAPASDHGTVEIPTGEMGNADQLPLLDGPAYGETPILDEVERGFESSGTMSELPLEGRWDRRELEIDGRHAGRAEIGLGLDHQGYGTQDAFYMLYEGEDAEDFHWLQFMWSEVIGLKDGVWSSLPGERIDSSVGSHLTAPGGTADSIGAPTGAAHTEIDGGKPWKDGHNLQEDAAVGAVDSPTFKRSNVQAIVEAHGLEAVRSRMHFEIFLVRNERRVASHARISMDWGELTVPSAELGLPTVLPAAPPVTMSAVEVGTSGGKLPEPFRTVFLDEYKGL